jgi:hypothetical protein
MIGVATSLTLTRTDRVCAEKIVMKMWRPCGAKILRISLSPAAAREYKVKTGKDWTDVETCLAPDGCGLRNAMKLNDVLTLLR